MKLKPKECNSWVVIEKLQLTLLVFHEIVIYGSIAENSIHYEKVDIIKHSKQLMEKKNILSGRTLSHANRQVPVCLMNPTEDPVIIRKGTIVGTFEPVDKVKEETERRCRKGSG